MSPATGRRRLWARRSGEAVVIVVSILLALVIDEAWGWGRERVEERELLEALRVEFEGAAEEVELDLVARGAVLERTDRLLALRSDPAATVPADSVPDIVRALIDWRFYTPAHAVLDDMLSSGRLHVIRSPEVRRALMRYPQERGRVMVLDQLERDFVTERMEPWLVGRVPLDRILGAGDAAALADADARRVVDLAREDDAFAGLVRLRRFRTEEASTFSRIVRRSIGDVREALEAAG